MDIVQGGNGPVQMQLLFRNCSLHGISKGKISTIKGFEENFDGKNAEISGLVPKVELLGNYKINGQILILPIKGHGRTNCTLMNLRYHLMFKMKSVLKNGKEYMEIEKLKIKINPSRVYTHMTGLFDGDKAMSKNMDIFFNNNWEIIWSELKPIIEDAFGQIFAQMINNVFSIAPYKELFKS